MFSKSTMKDDDIKAIIDALKNEFKQEINVLNDRIVHLEEQNQNLEQKNINLNINLNAFKKNNFAYLDAKIDVNHEYLLNQWNPFMQSTIEKVKDDLIETMKNSNLAKKVD